MFWISLILLTGILLLAFPSSAGGMMPTKVLVRVVSKGAKIIGSNVGGAAVRIADVETGETLAQGRQEGGTGETDRIMLQPRPSGKPVYGTPGAALFLAEIPLDRPRRVEIQAEAPLAYPQAIQRGSKTVTLIPGQDMVGEGVIIELDGLIVNILSPVAGGAIRRGEEVTVRAEVKML